MGDVYHLHGLLQKARNDATELKSMTREAPDGWQLWIMEDGTWSYLGKLTRKADIERLLMGYLPQPDER